MHERYEYLTNFIDADNIPTIDWLRALNFRAARVIDNYGVDGSPFIQFASKRS